MKYTIAALLFLFAAPLAGAQVPDDPSHDKPPVATTITAQDRARERASRMQDLAGVLERLAAAQERQARVEARLQRADRDRDAIARALLESARRSQDLEGDIAEIQTRLNALETDRNRIRASLAGRQEALVEVIAALQRMGTNPPRRFLSNPRTRWVPSAVPCCWVRWCRRCGPRPGRSRWNLQALGPDGAGDCR